MNTKTKNQRTSDSIEALMLLTIGMSSSTDALLAQKVLDAIEDLEELQERRKDGMNIKPVASDVNGLLPCPLCNAPVKWCGENEPDSEDNHLCHHIRCTNPACFADFNFTNTGDDLLPDEPEVLDSMTAEECLQPLRDECLKRFNFRAFMFQAGSDGTNGKPLTITLPDASSKAFWSGTGKSETFQPETYKRWVKEAIERAGVIAGISVEVK